MSKLKAERMTSKQKDEYVAFMRSAQRTKNAFIQSQEEENWRLQKVNRFSRFLTKVHVMQQVNDLQTTVTTLTAKLGQFEHADVPDRSCVSALQSDLCHQETINRELAQQVEHAETATTHDRFLVQVRSLLQENSRLRSDPFAMHMVHDPASKANKICSVEDLQGQNMSKPLIDGFV